MVYAGIPQTISVSLSGPLATSRGVWLEGHNRISKLKYKTLFPEHLPRLEKKMLMICFHLFFPIFFFQLQLTYMIGYYLFPSHSGF